nr:MAG TPA: hypothetical protein [Caudoviricetes sp.]
MSQTQSKSNPEYLVNISYFYSITKGVVCPISNT